jgi:hypothetical protein
MKEEPIYEVEDNGCQCTKEGIDSEWNWDKNQECWVCSGCGDTQ